MWAHAAGPPVNCHGTHPKSSVAAPKQAGAGRHHQERFPARAPAAAAAADAGSHLLADCLGGQASRAAAGAGAPGRAAAGGCLVALPSLLPALLHLNRVAAALQGQIRGGGE